MSILTKEELSSIIRFRDEESNLLYSIGVATIQSDDAYAKAHAAGEEIENLTKTYRSVVESQKTYAEALIEKYGTGSINLETGEITPV